MDILAAIDAKLAFHREQIDRLTAAREQAVELTALLGGSMPTSPSEKPPGKPRPRPSTDGPGASDQPRRLRIARHLLENGPLRVGELVAAGLGSQPTVNATMRGDPWFRKSGPGNLDPWELTEAGRAAATA